MRIPSKPALNNVLHTVLFLLPICAFIKRHKAEPFFFYLAYRAPHVPLDATKKYLDRFPGEMPERRRQCLAMLSAVDDGVGQVMATLRQNGLGQLHLSRGHLSRGSGSGFGIQS